MQVLPYHKIDQLQWSITWDSDTGGYRGVAGELETAAYLNPQAVLRAIGRGEAAQRRILLAEQVAGLVSYQQSSQPLEKPVFDKQAVLQRVCDLPDLRNLSQSAFALPQDRFLHKDALNGNLKEKVRAFLEEQKEKRRAQWQGGVSPRMLVTLRNKAGEILTIDSKAARLRRCQKRIHAWADTIEKVAPRRVRRASKKEQACKKKNWVSFGPRLVMLTLTYADADTAHKKSDGWKPNHIRDFMRVVKRKLSDRLLAYAWVLEMQERKSAHYHVLLYVKPGTDVPEPDTAGWWEHGLTRRETTVKNAHYLSKYTGKEYQKEDLPKGARLFCPWVMKDIPPKYMFEFRLSAIPAWFAKVVDELRETFGYDLHWSRYAGGGWVIDNTDEVYKSPWRVISIVPVDTTGPPDDDYEQGVFDGFEDQ